MFAVSVDRLVRWSIYRVTYAIFSCLSSSAWSLPDCDPIAISQGTQYWTFLFLVIVKLSCHPARLLSPSLHELTLQEAPELRCRIGISVLTCKHELVKRCFRQNLAVRGTCTNASGSALLDVLNKGPRCYVRSTWSRDGIGGGTDPDLAHWLYEAVRQRSIFSLACPPCLVCYKP